MPGVTIDLKTAETDRGRIEYDLYGTDGPVVLSVHAGLGGADQGRLFASRLQDDGFRILSPSRPGYLGTPLSSGRTLYETSTFTDDQKARRVDYIMNTDAARTFFEAGFDTTFPYEKRMPGTTNDKLQTRTMAIPFDRITAPTLVIHGTQDGDVPFEHGENAAAKIPGAQHRWMPNEEHLGFWLSPNSADVQRDARGFLHEHAPR